jgi:hypothetical protein
VQFRSRRCNAQLILRDRREESKLLKFHTEARQPDLRPVFQRDGLQTNTQLSWDQTARFGCRIDRNGARR